MTDRPSPQRPHADRHGAGADEPSNGCAGRRRLIVNADDFGMSDGLNRGILEAHRRGVVTSASLMVRWVAAAVAVAMNRDCGSLSLGLHVDLGEWAYRGGEWVKLYQVVELEDRRAVADEVVRQVERFRELTGGDPTHLDSHQHVHQHEPVRGILLGWAERLSVPLRHFSPRVRYCGEFYGQTDRGEPVPEAISTAALVRLVSDLPDGVTELACHPGWADDLDTMYGRERSEEVGVMCDPAVHAAIASRGIELCSFRDLTGGAADGGEALAPSRTREGAAP